MFSNHQFWIAFALFFCAIINIKTSFSINSISLRLKKIIGFVGLLGIIISLISLVFLSLHFNWWWFVNGILFFLLFSGVFFSLFHNRSFSYFSIFNIIFIPFLSWYGSSLNQFLSYSWFYNALTTIRDFFL